MNSKHLQGPSEVTTYVMKRQTMCQTVTVSQLASHVHECICDNVPQETSSIPQKLVDVYHTCMEQAMLLVEHPGLSVEHAPAVCIT